MADHPSFRTIERARQAFRLGGHQEALALAEAAYRMIQEIPGAPPQAALVTSWYGFLLGTVGGRPREGLRLCRQAAQQAFWEPRVYEHVARLELLAGSRRAALEAIHRGLQLAERDRELRSLRDSLGHRRPPPIGFLGRQHPLNVWLGRVRHRLTGPVGVERRPGA
ncbi:MAG: hypothetical protein Kow0062_27370 [Acidobacteriota bacterium]|nr:MAG: hypothetical protein D6738_10905 [Acidobacteriota bacterium]